MKSFIGSKLISAKPMTRADYNVFRGWNLPENENGEDKGWLVAYEDGGQANTKEYAGYISWSPDEVFNKAYRATDGLSFGLAIEALKKGMKVARSGWNGKSMFLFLVDGSTFQVNRAPLNKFYPEGTIINYLPHIDMKTADDKIVPWLASQTDVLADDWVICD